MGRPPPALACGRKPGSGRCHSSGAVSRGSDGDCLGSLLLTGLSPSGPATIPHHHLPAGWQHIFHSVAPVAQLQLKPGDFCLAQVSPGPSTLGLDLTWVCSGTCHSVGPLAQVEATGQGVPR